MGRTMRSRLQRRRYRHATDIAQPQLRGCCRHPFKLDRWHYVDIDNSRIATP